MTLTQTLSPVDLQIWIQSAKSGDEITYYVGETVATTNGKIEIADVAYRAFENGKVLLFQQPAGGGKFAYICKRIPEAWADRPKIQGIVGKTLRRKSR
jgi:hypothetical protein